MVGFSEDGANSGSQEMQGPFPSRVLSSVEVFGLSQWRLDELPMELGYKEEWVTVSPLHPIL